MAVVCVSPWLCWFLLFFNSLPHDDLTRFLALSPVVAWVRISLCRVQIFGLFNKCQPSVVSLWAVHTWGSSANSGSLQMGLWVIYTWWSSANLDSQMGLWSIHTWGPSANSKGSLQMSLGVVYKWGSSANSETRHRWVFETFAHEDLVPTQWFVTDGSLSRSHMRI